MRNILKGSIALTIFSLAILLFQFSCKKEAQAQNNTTLSKEEILVEKCWEVDHLHHVIDCAYSSYARGGENTTGIDYDKLRFTFYANGTGTHINSFGIKYTFTWKFSVDKRSIIMKLTSPTTATFTWEMVEIAGNYLHASVNLTISGDNNNIETFRLIQIP